MIQDCCGVMGLSTIQKATSAICQLSTGCATDTVDEYLCIGATTSSTSLQMFIKGVIKVFRQEFLKPPQPDKLKTIMAEYEECGFPGCKGSVDGMHWEWKNSPAGWAGQFQGKDKTPTIVLEGVASHSLRFWHAFVGTPGAVNDINVLIRSPPFSSFVNGELSRFPLIYLFIWVGAEGYWAGTEDQVEFTINSYTYHQAYYLADGIYPNWPVLVKTLRHATNPSGKLSSILQEAARKDIERAFGVLQIQWGMIAHPCRLWHL